SASRTGSTLLAKRSSGRAVRCATRSPAARPGDPSVLVRVEDAAAGHCDPERPQRVLDADRALVGGEHLRQALVDLRGLVRAAAAQAEALLAYPLLPRRPVDHAGL